LKSKRPWILIVRTLPSDDFWVLMDIRFSLPKSRLTNLLYMLDKVVLCKGAVTYAPVNWTVNSLVQVQQLPDGLNLKTLRPSDTGLAYRINQLVMNRDSIGDWSWQIVAGSHFLGMCPLFPTVPLPFQPGS